MYEFLQETVANNMTTAVRSIPPETTVGDLYRLFAAETLMRIPSFRTVCWLVSSLSWMR